MATKISLDQYLGHTLVPLTLLNIKRAQWLAEPWCSSLQVL